MAPRKVFSVSSTVAEALPRAARRHRNEVFMLMV